MNVSTIDTRKICTVSCFLGAAWLYPDHFLPWTSAVNDGLSIIGLILLSFLFFLGRGANHKFQPSKTLLAIVVVCCITILGQYLFGKLYFGGDAVIALMYISVWYIAVLVGQFSVSVSKADEVLNALITPWLFAAFISVGFAVAQLTGARDNISWAAELYDGRAYANLGQANNFSTVCFIALTCLFWLHQTKQVHSYVLGFGAIFLLLGMVASQSRTAWLQVIFLIVCACLFCFRVDLRVRKAGLLLLGIVFVVSVFLFPFVMDALLLPSTRSLNDITTGNGRFHLWSMMLDAIGREPLWGYGWLQVGAAHQQVALDYLPANVLFQNSHNFVLDLLLWNGLPIGALIVALLLWWIVTHINTCHDARIVWLLILVGGVVIHGMLEFPLEYAYFLIPVGLCMGAIDGYDPLVRNTVQLPRNVVLSCIAVLVCVFAWVSVEYFRADDNYRNLRLEAAHIGVTKMKTPAAEFQLLTQLGAFLKFVRMESMTNLAPDQLEWMRQVSLRYGYVPTLLKYALAAGLNGQTVQANKALARVCSMTTVKLCAESKASWKATQKSYPELQSIPFPEEQVSK